MPRSRSRFRRWRVLFFGAVVSVTVAVAASPASAAPALGQTQLSFDPLLRLGMVVGGVNVTPIAPAQIGAGGLYLPVVKQSASASFTNTVKHSGGFQIAYGGVRVGFRNPTFTIKGTPAKGVLTAEPVINGSVLPFQVPISVLTVTSAQTSKGQLTGKTKVSIDPNILNLINQVLGAQIIKPGQAWATTETRLPAPAPAPAANEPG